MKRTEVTKKNARVRMTRSKQEAELEEKLTKLTEEYERLRENMVSREHAMLHLSLIAICCERISA